MEKYVAISVKCPHCNASIMDDNLPLNNHPSIKININDHGREGELHLCANYGCFDQQSTIKVEKGSIVKMSCPHCGHDLSTSILCEECGAPMASLNLKIGGRVSICTRKGCTKHFVAFDNLSDAIRKFQHEYGDAF